MWSRELYVDLLVRRNFNTTIVLHYYCARTVVCVARPLPLAGIWVFPLQQRHTHQCHQVEPASQPTDDFSERKERPGFSLEPGE